MKLRLARAMQIQSCDFHALSALQRNRFWSGTLTGGIMVIPTGTRLCACEILDGKMQLG